MKTRVDDATRRRIERAATSGFSVREAAELLHVPKSTVHRVFEAKRERETETRRRAKRGDLHARERVEIGLDDLFFAMERVRGSKVDPDIVAAELGVPAPILRQLVDGVLLVPHRGRTLAVRLERGADREGALRRALDVAEEPVPESKPRVSGVLLRVVDGGKK